MPEGNSCSASRPAELVRAGALTPCEEPSGMAIDRAHHRLFVGCRNKLMAIVDAESGRVITTIPIGAGEDGNAFDPETQLAFSSNGDGTLTVVHEDAPDRFSVVQTTATQRGARTMALDERTHKLYLSTARFRLAATPGQRPAVVPGSFEVLVLAPRQ